MNLKLKLKTRRPHRPDLVKQIFVPVLLIGFLAVFQTNLTRAQSACTDQIDGKSRAQLEQELEACNQEIAEWTETLNKTRQDSASFTRDIAALTAKINAAQANIKAKNIAISNLTKDIAVKQSEISELENRLDEGKRAVASILRRTNEINSYSLLEAMLSDKDFSEFFVDIDTYASTKRALLDLSHELEDVKGLTEAEKIALNRKRESESAARAVLESAKKEVEVSQEEKKTLLAINKTKEKTYEEVLADRQAKAAQIRAVLFPLRDAEPIPFGTALRYADAASAKTGVNSALILAILKQETNLGANVGTCNRPQDSRKWREIMPGPLHYSNYIKNGRTCSGPNSPCSYRDDQSAFLRIIEEVERYDSPEGVPLSCPIGSVGWGGAMGPSQFIPTTWELFKSKIANALNLKAPDPWNPEHAVMATALYLEELIGTTGNSYVDQRTAACRYYSGKTCYGSNGPNVGLSYGNSVMALVSNIQRDIDFLRGV